MSAPAPVRVMDVAARDRPIRERAAAAMGAVLDSARYLGGTPVEALEAALAVRHRVAHAVVVGSGTDALMLGLQALGVGPGDEVVVPAVTFFSTAGAVRALGAVPVVVDVLPDRPLLDPELAAAALGPRTRAVIPVHLFGDRAALPTVGVPVLEDGAQAIGCSPAGGAGMTLSFYPSKVLGAAGDGGAVLTDDAALAARVRALGFHGRQPDGSFDRVRGAPARNCRLDAVQAAFLGVALGDLDRRVARRRAIAARYDAELGLSAVPRDASSPVSVYCVRHPDREALAAALAARGVETRVYYSRPLGDEPALADLARRPTPHADRFCREALALPMHAALTDDDVQRVVDAVREAA